MAHRRTDLDPVVETDQCPHIVEVQRMIISPLNYLKDSVAESDISGEHLKHGMPDKHDIDGFINTTIDVDGDTPLHVAIICFYAIEQIICLINTLLNRFPDYDFLNHQNYQYRQTPLHLAVLSGRTDIVRSLVDLGAQTTLQDNQLRTPAHIACGNGDAASLKALLESEVNGQTRSVGLYDNQGQTCLHIAVLKGDIEIVHILLDHGADINATDIKSGRTALHFSAEVGDIRMVTLLLGNKWLELNALTFAGYNALQLAKGRPKSSPEVIAVLRTCYPDDEDLSGLVQSINATRLSTNMTN